MCYDASKPVDELSPLAAGGSPAFQQQAGERRRRALSLQLASPPVATRNGLASLAQMGALWMFELIDPKELR